MEKPRGDTTDGLHCPLLTGLNVGDDGFSSGGMNSGRYGAVGLVLRVRRWMPVNSRGSLS